MEEISQNMSHRETKAIELQVIDFLQFHDLFSFFEAKNTRR